MATAIIEPRPCACGCGEMALGLSKYAWKKCWKVVAYRKAKESGKIAAQPSRTEEKKRAYMGAYRERLQVVETLQNVKRPDHCASCHYRGKVGPKSCQHPRLRAMWGGLPAYEAKIHGDCPWRKIG